MVGWVRRPGINRLNNDYADYTDRSVRIQVSESHPGTLREIRETRVIAVLMVDADCPERIRNATTIRKSSDR
jgi:hypothetical protein